MIDKKLPIIIALSVLCALFAYSEQATDDPSLAIGTYGLAQTAVGPYSEFARFAAGGGAVGEYALWDLPGFGVSARVQAAAVVPASDIISSYWALGAFAGAYRRISLSRSVSVQPELAAGFFVHVLEATGKDGSSLSSGKFVDPAFQASVAIRRSFGRVEVELAPVATVIPEKSAVLGLAGLRVGALYSIR